MPAIIASCLHELTVNYFLWAELCTWPGNVSLWLCLAWSSANLYQFYFSIFPLAEFNGSIPNLLGYK